MCVFFLSTCTKERSLYILIYSTDTRTFFAVIKNCLNIEKHIKERDQPFSVCIGGSGAPGHINPAVSQHCQSPDQWHKPFPWWRLWSSGESRLVLISMKDMPGWQHAELGTTATVGNPPPFLLPQLGGRGVGVGSLRNTKETRVLRSHLSFPHTLRRPHHQRQIKGKGGLTSSSTPTGLKRCTHEKPLSYKDSDKSPHSLTKAHTLEHVLP